MLVRQLIGSFAGHKIEMKYADAQRCIAAGTACIPGEEPKVRGLVMVDDEPESAPAHLPGPTKGRKRKARKPKAKKAKAKA